MNTKKYNNFLRTYTGFKGSRTLEAIMDKIPVELKHLSGKELGLVANAINESYHSGKAACGAEIVDGDAIWINKLNKLVELDKIAELC